MKSSTLSLYFDNEFLLMYATQASLIADAYADGRIEPFRVLSIVLMFGLIITHYFSKRKLLREKNIPFLFVVGKPDARFRDTFNKVESVLPRYRIKISTLEKAFGLMHEDWVFHQDAPLDQKPASWRRCLDRIENMFWHTAERVPGQKTFHFFMNGPAALALGLGAAIGSRNRYVFYHYSEGKIPYTNLIDFSDKKFVHGHHILKKKLEEYRYILTEGLDSLEKSGKTEVLVAVDLAGHSAAGAVKNRSKETGLPCVIISSIFRGDIPMNDSSLNWIDLCHEIISVLLDLSGREKIKRIHLFLSVPLPVAFTVGSALGKFVKMSVYNYFPATGTYSRVFNMEEG